MNRVSVVGVTGSGKTTFARRLAEILDCAQVELDSLHWEPNWVEAPRVIFRDRVARALSGERWVVDGNYSKVRDIIWSRAETIVWLDYSLPLIFWRLARRTFERIVHRKELWNGNRESLRNQFSRDSLFIWAITSRRRHHHDYPRLFYQYAHLHVMRFHTPRKTETWLALQKEKTSFSSKEQGLDLSND